MVHGCFQKHLLPFYSFSQLSTVCPFAPCTRTGVFEETTPPRVRNGTEPLCKNVVCRSDPDRRTRFHCTRCVTHIYLAVTISIRYIIFTCVRLKTIPFSGRLRKSFKRRHLSRPVSPFTWRSARTTRYFTDL